MINSFTAYSYTRDIRRARAGDESVSRSDGVRIDARRVLVTASRQIATEIASACVRHAMSSRSRTLARRARHRRWTIVAPRSRIRAAR